MKLIHPSKILAGIIRMIRQNMKMAQHLTLVKFLSTFSLWLIPALLDAREPQIEVQQILQTPQSWDGTNYQSYPDDVSRFHDERTSRAGCFLRRTGWGPDYHQ
jgi:hypothetical protein